MTTSPAPTGTLYGVGVGPGDPELLTIKAARVLGEAEVILAAASTKNDYSLALAIAAPHLRPGARTEVLGFPMTREAGPLSKAWEKNADRVAEVLRESASAAFLTLGDPLLYSTFGYLLRTLARRHPGIRTEIVPGVTSFQAAAAASGTVLAESGQSLTIIPGVANNGRLQNLLAMGERVVLLKAYRNFAAIREALRATGRDAGAVFATRLGMEDQWICRDLDLVQATPHYLSLIIAGDGGDAGDGENS